MITEISSRENRLIKEYVRLSGNAALRRKSRKFVVEGARLVKDAILSGAKIERAFFTDEAMQKHGELRERLESEGVELYRITRPLAEKLADTKTPQGVFGTVFILDKELPLDKINIYGLFAALEDIQDPGNLGTILRTAEALGFDGVFLSGGCADVYSPKVVRASMGAVFRLPLMVTADLPKAVRTLGEAGLKTFAAVADADAPDLLSADFSRGAVTAIGNEGNGLTAECVKACGGRVTIRMPGRAESLNASTAASIIMWEMQRRRV